tara:strand:- start:780 stop:1145 length:366 start_codon:yes stop_codon:yes gene_type:complete
MLDVDPVCQIAGSIFPVMNDARLQAYSLQGLLGQILIEASDEFGKTVTSSAADHPMAFPDDIDFKLHSITKNPVSTLEDAHTIVRHLLIQAEVDMFTHSLKIYFGVVLAITLTIITSPSYP